MLTPFSVQYALLVEEQRVTLYRIERMKVSTVWHSNEIDTGNIHELRTALWELTENSGYSGQSITVLMHNRRCFTYAAQAAGEGQALLKSKLQMLNSSDLMWRHTVRRVGKQPVFVAQGVSRDFYEGLCSSFGEIGIRTISITTLGAHLIGRIALDDSKPTARFEIVCPNDSIYRVYVNSDSICFCRDSGEPFSFRQLKPDDTTTPKVSSDLWSLRDSLSDGPDGAVQMSLAELLRQKDSFRRDDSIGGFATPTSRSAMIVSRTTNVAKLLVMVLAAIAVLLGLGNAGLLMATNDSNRQTKNYQELYTEKMAIERTSDSLLTAQQNLNDSQAARRNPAVFVSLFGQKRIPGAYIERITLSYVEEDTVYIVAEGFAGSESAVFSYREFLNGKLGSNGFEIASVAPTVRPRPGRTDTMLQFSLSMREYAGLAEE